MVYLSWFAARCEIGLRLIRVTGSHVTVAAKFDATFGWFERRRQRDRHDTCIIYDGGSFVLNIEEALKRPAPEPPVSTAGDKHAKHVKAQADRFSV